MLTESFIEALLVDEDLADTVWEAWNAGLLPDDEAAWAWWSIFDRSIAVAGESRSDRPVS